ncbi:MAG: hypothetical protein G3M70_10350 [Candidatus Nitronauta litoralis]|uniref:Transglutaminase-like domain-containing protein n=1 Tax=Candidatus Nitronauta litoralis TaxID=2705533 RepID=A0A7T0BWF2_9BACT|nr:MAG: hypothetical protein G3M70_10350 [Candidatus Nitronauta litoralis]
MKKTALLILVLLILVAGLPALAASPLAVQERDEWSGTYFKGHKLGFTHSQVKHKGKDLEVHTRVFFRLHAGGEDQTTIISQITTLDENLQLKKFSLLQEIMGSRQRVLGQRVNDKLEYEVTTSGYQKTKSMDFPVDVVPSSTAWLNILDRGLDIGKKGTLKLFIEPFQMIVPMTYAILRHEKVDIKGQSHDAIVVVQEYGGMKTTLWVTPDGSVLRESTQQGFESLQEDKNLAQKLDKKAISVSNFITLSLVTPNRAIKNPGNLSTLKLKMSALQKADSVPQDQRQKILKAEPDGQGGFMATVLIQRERAMQNPGPKRPVTDVPDPKYLEEAAEIQSRNGLIRGQARLIVGRETDAWKSALLINGWVHEQLEKVMVDAFTALDALNSKRGECQSHTNLFTALARAEGIPTRVVNGLVYSKKYKGFLYHAWPEVYVGEWRALDPTFGQDAVDATHIKLSVGNYQGAIKLMEFLGKVQVEILDN